MVLRWLYRQHSQLSNARSSFSRLQNRRFSISPVQYAQAKPTQDAAQAALKRTRNIGIIAHIDAVCDIYALLPRNTYTFSAGQNNYYGAHALLQRLYQTDRR